MPREETIAFAAWLPVAKRSLWLPVQVCSAAIEIESVPITFQYPSFRLTSSPNGRSETDRLL
eukprot:404648-Amphidinium_carterae.1